MVYLLYFYKFCWNFFGLFFGDLKLLQLIVDIVFARVSLIEFGLLFDVVTLIKFTILSLNFNSIQYFFAIFLLVITCLIAEILCLYTLVYRWSNCHNFSTSCIFSAGKSAFSIGVGFVGCFLCSLILFVNWRLKISLYDKVFLS